MNAPPTTCLNCQVPLVPGMGFCGTCGTPAGQSGAAARVPPAYPMPPTFNGGTSATVALPPMNPAAATTHVANALSGAGATVTGTSANAVAFVATRSSKRTLGLKARFGGIADVAPGAGGTAATIRIKLEIASIVPVLLIVALVGFAAAFLSLAQTGGTGDPTDAWGQIGGGIGIGLLGPYFLISRGSGRVVLDHLTRAVSTGGPAAQGFAASPAPHAPAPAPAPAPMSVSGMFEQLRELGALRDQGVLSAAEHDQARAALLAKIA